ncbi:MAG: DUF1992 domain-containing protein [Nocardioides sp.]|nr:DUF1992 domain-containing protein [Nocardioides sp.]
MPESEDWPEGRPVEPADKRRAVDGITGSPAAANRIREQHKWVDLQVKQAIERGEFDDLPGAGKPIKDLGAEHDPDWWLKQLVEREQIAVVPASVQLRKDDAELDALLDEQPSEEAARKIVEAFNERVIAARYRLPEGPPLITMPRDVEKTLTAWRERRAARAEQARVRREAAAAKRPARRRWWQRRS